MNMNNLKIKNKIKVFFSKDLREQIENCGICSDCKEPNTGYAWCNKCDPGRFIREGKTSGNNEMDDFIHERQKQTLHYYDNLEWIPYDRFEKIEPIGEGGFSNIYSATWLDGAPKFDKKKVRSGLIKVALKKLKKNSDMMVFINETRIHDECNYANSHITQLYGITRDPDTNDFMMVLEYATDGNLRNYLKENFSNLTWEDKLEMLINIIDDLEFIHDRNYIHKDLHSGNILQFNYDKWCDTKITDLGLAQLVDNFDNYNSTCVCGVLPYIAPEILNSKPYTFASDIYSFGIIMVEVSTGKSPYESVPHDETLALAICNGLRPRIAKGTPKCYIDLVSKCLDANPKNRPSSKEILKIIRNWRFHDEHKQVLNLKKLISKFNLKKTDSKDIKMVKEFTDADKIVLQESSFETSLHPGAIYASRLMSFTIQIEDPEVCHEPLTQDEKEFIVEEARKYSVTNHWKSIISGLEKKYGRLHSENKVKNFWKRKQENEGEEIIELLLD